MSMISNISVVFEQNYKLLMASSYSHEGICEQMIFGDSWKSGMVHWLNDVGGWYEHYGTVIVFSNNNRMRSVSIVYKKTRPHEQSLREVPQSRTLIKRSVDEYYTRLIEKERYKEDAARQKEAALQRIKLKTSNSQRQGDKFNILQTLSIAQISLRQPQPQTERDEVRSKLAMGIGGMVMEKRESVRGMLKGLELSTPLGYFQQQEKEQKSAHCKLKCLYKSKGSGQVKETIIVLTANFIANEHYFWDDEPIQDQCLKFWRLLQSYASIVWICQKEATFRKLSKFAKASNLRLDAVYLLIPRKTKRITFSCYSIENDFGVKFHRSNMPLVSKEDRKMVVLSGVTGEKGMDVNWRGLMNGIPIIRNCRSIVHFLRIDMNDKTRLNIAVKILSQQASSISMNVGKLMDDFQKNQSKNKVQEECSCMDKNVIQESPPLLGRIEEMKARLIRYFTQSLSLNLTDRIVYDQSQNSLQFIIGDALRRNFKILQEADRYIEAFGAYTKHRKAHEGKNQVGKEGKVLIHSKKYRNNAYWWDL